MKKLTFIFAILLVELTSCGKDEKEESKNKLNLDQLIGLWETTKVFYPKEEKSLIYNYTECNGGQIEFKSNNTFSMINKSINDEGICKERNNSGIYTIEENILKLRNNSGGRETEKIEGNTYYYFDLKIIELTPSTLVIEGDEKTTYLKKIK